MADVQGLAKVIADHLEQIVGIFAILGISILGVARWWGQAIANAVRAFLRRFKGNGSAAPHDPNPIQYKLSISLKRPSFFHRTNVKIRGKRNGSTIIYEIPFFCKITKGQETPQYGVYINVPLPYTVVGAIGQNTVNTTNGFNSELSAGGILFHEIVFRIKGPDKVGVNTPLGRIALAPNSNAPDYVEILWHVKYFPPKGRYPYNRDLKMRIQFEPPP